MKKHNLLLSITMLAIFSLTFISCDKEDEVPVVTDFVGYWSVDETMSFGDQTISVSTTFHFTESGFELSAQIEPGITMFQMSGDLSVSGNEMTLTPKTIGMPNMETGTMEYVNKGNEGWDAVLSEMEMNATEKAIYAVEGNTITIMFEGDTPQVFTKQVD